MNHSIEIRIATATDRARIEAHLLRLSPRDRSLRFAAGLVTDETIRAYVAGFRFGSDALLAMVDDDGGIVGLAHGCVYRAAGELRLEAAFSIDEDRRGEGLGSALMAAIDAFATDCGARALVGVCVARNLPMRRIFERAGMTMTREEDDLHAFRATTASAPMPSCVSGAPA